MILRVFVTAWLSLLLVGMQQQVIVHEVDHLRAKVQRGSDVAIQNAGDGACLECALLAGGSNAVPVGNADTVLSADIAPPGVHTTDSAPATRPPVYYQSRAPPPYA